jgi:hypothetical protein
VAVAPQSEWTFGAEHEWADWPIDARLPAGCERNTKDHTIANSSGIANDPTGRTCRIGGEINTRPTATIDEQVRVLRDLKRVLPGAKVNYRSNLHIHIRAPGLKDDLAALKRVQAYICAHMPSAFDAIAPLPRPTLFQFKNKDVYAGAERRWRRCLVSHRTLVPPPRLSAQFAAGTVDAFFAAEVPQKDGRPLWHLQPRACVNLRQLLETDTVEFRHFPGTLDESEFWVCLEWCRRFLDCALRGKPFDGILRWARIAKFPQFPPYDHWIDVRFRATVHDGSIKPEAIRANVKAILDGTFTP